MDTPYKEIAQMQARPLSINCTAEGPSHINVTWYKVLQLSDNLIT